MSELTKRFFEFCAPISVEILNFIDNYSVWLLPAIVFILVFVGNILWGLTGAFFCLIIPISIMSFLYHWLNTKNNDAAQTNESRKFGTSNLHSNQTSSSRRQVKVTVRTTSNSGMQNPYSLRSELGNQTEAGHGDSDVGTSDMESMRREDDDFEGDDSSTIAERFGTLRTHQRNLTPAEWSNVTSPGFSSRVVQHAMGQSPLREYNSRGLNQSPFQFSPNRDLRLGEIPYGSKWRRSPRSPTQFRFPTSEPLILPVGNMYTKSREAKENGTVYLKIAPMEGSTLFPNSPKCDSSDLELPDNSGMFSGLGGIAQSDLSRKYNRLQTSANTSLERSLRMRNNSTSASGLSIVEALANRKGKRNRGQDSPLEQSPGLRNSFGTSSLNMSGDDNPKDSKRVKFIMPGEPHLSRNLSMLPLTSHNNPENVNMTSESILEQMNQTEKRFLPDDDSPPSIRPLPKKPRATDRLQGNKATPSTPIPNSFRKRKVSTTAFNLIEDGARGKAPRFCNCTECYEEAAGLPAPEPSEENKSRSVKTVTKISTCERATETDVIPALTSSLRFFKSLPIPVSKERYDADKKLRIDRLQRMLEVSLKKSQTEIVAPPAAGSLSSNFNGSNHSDTPDIGLQATTNPATFRFGSSENSSGFTPFQPGTASFGFTSSPSDSAPTILGLLTQQNSNSSGNFDAGIIKDSPTTGNIIGTQQLIPEKTAAFGTQCISPPTSASLGFGTAEPSSANAFGTPSGVPANSSNTFASQENTSNPTANTFGSLQNNSEPTANIIGSQQNTSNSAAAANTFGSQQNTSTTTTTSNVFGSQQNPSTTSASVFGSQQNTPNIIGSQLSSTPATTSSTGMFGSLTSPTVVGSSGNNGTGGILGSQQQNAPSFGSSPMFGGQQKDGNPPSYSNSGFGTQQSVSSTTSPPAFGFKQNQPNNTGGGSGTGAFAFGAPQTPASTSAFGIPNANTTTTLPTNGKAGGLFQFGQPQQAQSTTTGGFNFGGANPPPVAPASASANQMFNLGASSTPSNSAPTILGLLTQQNSNSSVNFDAGIIKDSPATGNITGAQQLIPENTTAFGTQSISTPKPTSLGFGTAAPSSASAFGTQPSGVLTNSSNIFGSLQNAANPTANIFGSQQNLQSTSNPTANIFGSQPNTTNPTSNIFGSQPNTSNPTANIFGSQQNTSNPTTNIFGSQQNTSNLTSNMFGSQQNTSNPTATANIFGSQQNTSTNTTGNIFGSQQNTSTTTTTANLFGSQQNASTTSANVFGSQQNASTTSANLFGSQQNTPNLIGSQLLSTPTTTTGVFGSLTSPGVVGTSGNTGTGGIFGSQQRNAPTFGSPPMFGAQQKDGNPPSYSSSGFGNQQSVSNTTSPPAFGFNQNQPNNGGSSTVGFAFGATQMPASTSAFGFPNANATTTSPTNGNAGGLFQFGQPQQAQGTGGFNFGGANPPQVAPAPGNQMFSVGASSTPRRRDANARTRRYR